MKNTKDCKRLSYDSLIPEFIIGANVNIYDMNSAAMKLFGLNDDAVKYTRLGNALKCVHSKDKTIGCGYGGECKKCPIRISVGKCADNLTKINSESQVNIKIREVDTIINITFKISKLTEVNNRFFLQVVNIIK